MMTSELNSQPHQSRRQGIFPALLLLALGAALLLLGGCAEETLVAPSEAALLAFQANDTPVPAATSTPTAVPQDVATPAELPTLPPTSRPEAARTPTPEVTSGQTNTPLPSSGFVVVASGEDTTLDAWAPTTNWSADTRTRVRQGNIASALLRFDSIPLPPEALIGKATLRLFVVSQSNWRNLTLVAYPLRRHWEGAAATWKQATSAEPWAVAGCDGVPADREGTVLAYALFPKEGNALEIDVTAAVRAWVAAPEENYGLLLKGEGGASVEYTLASFEHALADFRPRLTIHYALPTPTPTSTGTATLTPTVTETPTVTQTPTDTPLPTETATPTETFTPGATPSDTPTPTWTITPTEPATATPTPSPSTTLEPTMTPTPGPSPTPIVGVMVLQDGEDTTINAWFPNTNYGNDERLYLRQGNVASALVRFSSIPLHSSATVTSAKLRLYVVSQSNVHSQNLVAYTVRRNWDELAATWNNASITQRWTVAGCDGVPADREGTMLGKVTIPNTGNWLEIDVTEAVRLWVATPVKNQGLLLKGDGSVSVESRLASFEYYNAALRPMLIINYSMAHYPPTPTPTRTSTPTKTRLPTPTGTPGGPAPTAWTFMLYVAGDNNLSGYLRNDLRLLENLRPNPSIKLLVLADLMQTNYDWRYEVQPGGNYTIGVNKWFLGEVNTGDPKTLSDFIIWGRENYPAEHYCVVIIDHGRGTSGMARDETNNYDILTAAELRTAFDTATQGGQWEIDVVHYYACLMGMLEQAHEIKDYAHYWIACQNIGWLVPIYERYLANNRVDATTTAEELAVGIAEAYHKDTLLSKSLRDIAVLDLTQIGPVMQALDSLAMSLRDNLGLIRGSMSAVRSATQKLDSRDYFKINDADEYLDLYDLTLRLQEHLTNSAVLAATPGLLEALDSFIVAAYHDNGTGGAPAPSTQDLSNAHGISIYFPPDGATWDYNYYVNNRLFHFTTESLWDEFLTSLYGTKQPLPPLPTDVEWPPMLRP